MIILRNRKLNQVKGTGLFFMLFVLFTFLLSCRNQNVRNRNSDMVLRFAVASDGHYGQQDTDYKGNYDLLISNFNREFAGKGLDFVVLNGDIFYNDPKYLPEVKKVLNGLKMPFYPVRGNHDRATEKDWEKVWGISGNYDFEMDNYAVILASTSDTSGAYLCADNEWLWDRLDHYQSKKGVFVFMHITPKKWTGHGVDCPEISNALEAHSNVLAVFQGHDHDEDAMKVSNGIPWYFDGHFGGGCWGTGYRGYRVVEVLKNGSVRTYEYNMDVTPVVNENLQHLAFLKEGKLKFPPSEKAFPGALSLTDGVFGTIHCSDGKWTGFEGTDFEWTLNLGQIKILHEINAGFLVNSAMGIFPPESIEFLVSTDGTRFSRVYFKEIGKSGKNLPVSIQRYSATLKGVPCRVVTIRAVHQKTLPENFSGKDKKPWLFVDEIVIN